MLQISSKKSISSQRGVSLLELIFALSVAAMIVLFAVGRYKQSQQDYAVAVTQRSVQTLLQALNHYFYQNCNKRSYETEFNNVAKILDGFNEEMKANPLGSPFVVQIQEFANIENRPIYRLRLMADYPTAAIADFLRKQLGADAPAEVQPGTSLIWTRLPSLSTADPSAAYWVQSDAFNQGATQGLRAYVRQNPNTKIYMGVCNNRGLKPEP